MIRDKNREFLVQKLKQRMLEKGSVQALFDDIDGDGDGGVTMKELKLAFLRMNITLVAADFTIYFNEMDKDNNGVVDVSELDQYLKHPPRPKNEDMRCMYVTKIHTRGSPMHMGTADRRVGWEQRRAEMTQKHHHRKFVQTQFGNQLAQANMMSFTSSTCSLGGFKVRDEV
jgi:hypothetical protein